VPGQSKESLYNLSDSYVVNIQTSLQYVLSQGKEQRRSVLSIPRTISGSINIITWNTIDLRDRR
jgi:hypothetical protein